MSDADDRMERAARIREMRQSRDRPDAGESEAAERDGPTATDAEAGDDTGSEETDEVDRADLETDEPVSTDESAALSSTNGGTVTGGTAGGDGALTVDAATQLSGASPDAAGDDGTARPSAGAGLAPLGGATGFSLSKDADEDEVGTDGERAARARSGTSTAATESSVRVLEFTVGDQTYCFDIERVEEIVKRETVTRVPNTAAYVEGVVDLRGQITTILDSQRLLDVDASSDGGLLVIFAPDAFEEHGSVGWVVDEVRQVVPVTDEQVRTPPTEDDHVRGIVDRDGADDLVVWIRPGVAMSRAVDGEADDVAAGE